MLTGDCEIVPKAVAVSLAPVCIQVMFAADPALLSSLFVATVNTPFRSDGVNPATVIARSCRIGRYDGLSSRTSLHN
jgi:hypothetical protein